METRLKEEEVLAVRIKYGFDFCQVVEFIGSGRKKAEEANKRKTWMLLEEVIKWGGDQVVCFGDFNDIIVEHEKVEGVSRTSSRLSWGRQTLDLCHLIDLGFTQRFDPIKVSHLPRHGYDHVAIRVILEADSEEPVKRRKHIFRFEEVWLKDSICEGLIEQLWNGVRLQGHHHFQAMHVLDEHFKEYKIGSVTKELTRLEALLKEDSRWYESLEEIKTHKALKAQSNKLMKMKEII
ncbi:unnamed protein product [Vicia faba]|uniref:Uncharacterized protein n=1 Tax=Vicia faba TaxID=3906 RepID=A0AAV0Z419_VICFA|nr:unnamed protein product [Vicia faba]